MIDRIYGRAQVHVGMLETMSSTPPVINPRKTKGSAIALSPRQRDVLEAIRTLHKRDGLVPSRAEIAAHLNLKSVPGIETHLQIIARRGWLRIEAGTQRGLVLLREGAPLYEPDALRRRNREVESQRERPAEPEWIDCERLWTIFGQVPDLLLWIRDDAMERDGLADGGIVALARTLDAQRRITVGNGDIVAARIGEDVTLRRVCAIDEATFKLRAESTNRKHKSVRVESDTDDVEIIGVVIGRVLAGAG